MSLPPILRTSVCVLHVFDNEAVDTRSHLVESDKHLFLAMMHGILKEMQWTEEEAHQFVIERFAVVVSERPLDKPFGSYHKYGSEQGDYNKYAREFGFLHKHASELGYPIIVFTVGGDHIITGGKIELIACSLTHLKRTVVLHDLPFTSDSAEKVFGTVTVWENSDRRWCLLLGKPKGRFLLGSKEGFHFGIAKTTYLEEGLLDTSVDVATKGTEYDLAEVFKILIGSAKKHGWWEEYFDAS